MEPCLIDKKICKRTNLRCKVCKLETCKEVLRMIEDEQYYDELHRLKKLKEEIPEQCKGCSFLDIINVRKEKVYCPYYINGKCYEWNNLVNASKCI